MPRRNRRATKPKRELRPDQKVERLAVLLHEPRNEPRLQYIFGFKDPEVRLEMLRKLAQDRGTFTSF